MSTYSVPGMHLGYSSEQGKQGPSPPGAYTLVKRQTTDDKPRVFYCDEHYEGNKQVM